MHTNFAGLYIPHFRFRIRSGIYFGTINVEIAGATFCNFIYLNTRFLAVVMNFVFLCLDQNLAKRWNCLLVL